MVHTTKMVKILMASLFLIGYSLSAQNKYEREHRIKKSKFPENALEYIEAKLKDVRQLRFYRETDSSKTSFEAKFKKDRLKYSVEFTEDGELEDIEILIKPVDIPDETFSNINKYLEENFIKFRIRKIQQQYPVGENDVKTTIKNAFQNLILPYINYKLVIAGKRQKTYEQFEVLFDSDGNFTSIRKSLPPNYDHILY